MGKWCLQASLFIFNRIFVKLAGNQDMHKMSNQYDFGPDRTIHVGVTNVLAIEWQKVCGKPCLHANTVSFDSIFIKLAGQA